MLPKKTNFFFSQSFTAEQAYPEREFKKKSERKWLPFEGFFIIIIILFLYLWIWFYLYLLYSFWCKAEHPSSL